jgi:hypothetical protein
MKSRLAVACVLAAVVFSSGADLFACGEKFLVVGRGTRYQRPKNFRAASIVIYADPASGLPAALKSIRADSALRHEGHRATTVQTPEQLSALLAGGRFDVVLAAPDVAASIEKLLGASPDRTVVVPVSARVKANALLDAIDKAVELRDQNARKLRS